MNRSGLDDVTIVDAPDTMPDVVCMAFERDGDYVRGVQMHTDGSVHITAWQQLDPLKN